VVLTSPTDTGVDSRVYTVHEDMGRACRNIGRPGLAGYAISAVEPRSKGLEGSLAGRDLEHAVRPLTQE
jgi:hypothetical protein